MPLEAPGAQELGFGGLHRNPCVGIGPESTRLFLSQYKCRVPSHSRRLFGGSSCLEREEGFERGPVPSTLAD